MTTIERLFLHVQPEPNSGCWLWTGSIGPGRHRGYGRINMNGRVRPAHLVMYESLRGPIPNGLELDHLCRVKCCVNPDHLDTVTHKVNMERACVAIAAGRRKQVAIITHCPAGHPYSGANLYITPSGSRSCVTCKRSATKQWREQQKLVRSGK